MNTRFFLNTYVPRLIKHRQTDTHKYKPVYYSSVVYNLYVNTCGDVSVSLVIVRFGFSIHVMHYCWFSHIGTLYLQLCISNYWQCKLNPTWQEGTTDLKCMHCCWSNFQSQHTGIHTTSLRVVLYIVICH